jgi:hypothetical protein
MKNLSFTIAFIFFTQLTFTQYFTLPPNGFVSAEKKAYLIVDVPAAKQAELYKNTLSALSTMYNSPKEVLSLVDGESISLHAYEKQVITDKVKSSNPLKGKITYKYDLSYTLSIQFKDGKIRFNSPTFECKRWYENGYSQGWTSGWTSLPLVKTNDVKWAVFNENGAILSEEAFEGLNKFFNSLFKEIIEKSKTANKW